MEQMFFKNVLMILKTQNKFQKFLRARGKLKKHVFICYLLPLFERCG